MHLFKTLQNFLFDKEYFLSMWENYIHVYGFLSVEELKNVILDLKKENKIIILSSHRMDQVDKICDDILIIDKGNEVLKGELKVIKQKYNDNISLEDIFIERVEEKEHE